MAEPLDIFIDLVLLLNVPDEHKREAYEAVVKATNGTLTDDGESLTLICKITGSLCVSRWLYALQYVYFSKEVIDI